jgi:hypothetical protein
MTYKNEVNRHELLLINRQKTFERNETDIRARTCNRFEQKINNQFERE